LYSAKLTPYNPILKGGVIGELVVFRQVSPFFRLIIPYLKEGVIGELVVFRQVSPFFRLIIPYLKEGS
jgi:hypothetical protein